MRIPPATDNKGIASWNFQLLSALIDVTQYCKINSIQQAAHELINKSLQGIHTTFLDHENEKTRIRTTTTRSEHAPQFEDYAFFADSCFRAYEISGEKSFFESAKNTVGFIFKEFYQDHHFYTRSISYNESYEYKNIHTPIFDQSYKSPLGNLICNLRKWSTVIPDFNEYLATINQTTENLTHLSLQNPLAFGETLRGLVYPDEAYRKVEVPIQWLKERSFATFCINFSARFALVYHDRDQESWQICTLKECELQGKGMDEFTAIFSAPPTKENSQDDKE